MSKELINIIETEISSRWNGSTKDLTINCQGCEYYINKNKESRCYWGIAYKRLEVPDRLKKCQVINKPSPRKEYLNIK